MQSVHNEIGKLGELDLLTTAEQMIDNACHEVRRLSHDMMPGALMDLGLIDAVEDLIEKFESESGMIFNIEDATKGVKLTDIQKVQLYRTIQEILTNSVRHADAETVIISFSNTANSLKIRVADDGQGFDITSAKFKNGMGLKNIDSRIKYLNGDLITVSKIGEGVSYTISIPLSMGA